MSVAWSHSNNSAVFDRFKAFYRDFGLIKLDDIDSLYAPHVFFKDPVHEIRGLNALHNYLGELCTNLSSCRFEYLDELVNADRAYIKWNMHFKHPKLGPAVISTRGISHLQFHDDKIVYHEDVYDMGALIYEHLPVLGATTRWLKNRLAQTKK